MRRGYTSRMDTGFGLSFVSSTDIIVVVNEESNDVEVIPMKAEISRLE